MYSPTPSIEGDHPHFRARSASVVHGFTRRHLLSAAVVLTGSGLIGAANPAFGQPAPARPTPEQVTGPFYPVRLPADQDADLTVIAGTAVRALGTIVYLSGRVTNHLGEAVPHADVEIWQANAVGRYTHTADDNPQPIDPNFDGYARIRTDSEGRYRFKTMKPGAYPLTAVPGWNSQHAQQVERAQPEYHMIVDHRDAPASVPACHRSCGRLT